MYEVIIIIIKKVRFRKEKKLLVNPLLIPIFIKIIQKVLVVWMLQLKFSNYSLLLR